MKAHCIAAGCVSFVLLVLSFLCLGRYYGGIAAGLVSLVLGLIVFYFSAGLLQRHKKLLTPEVLLPLFGGVCCGSILLVLIFSGGRNYGLAALSAFAIIPFLLLAAGLAARFLIEKHDNK